MELKLFGTAVEICDFERCIETRPYATLNAKLKKATADFLAAAAVIDKLRAMVQSKIKRADIHFTDPVRWRNFKGSAQRFLAYAQQRGVKGEGSAASDYIEARRLGKYLDVGAAIQEGALSGTPLLEGVVTSCVNLAMHCDTGTGLQGRHKEMSEEQLDRVQQAACDLMSRPSRKLLHMLGMNTETKVRLVLRDAANYPAFWAAFEMRALGESLSKAVGMLRAHQDVQELLPIVVCADETYLWKKFDLAYMADEPKLLGGAFAWGNDASKNQAALDPDQRENVDDEEAAAMIFTALAKRTDTWETVPISIIPQTSSGTNALFVEEFFWRIVESSFNTAGSYCTVAINSNYDT